MVKDSDMSFGILVENPFECDITSLFNIFLYFQIVSLPVLRIIVLILQENNPKFLLPQNISETIEREWKEIFCPYF